MSRSVDEVQNIGLAVFGFVVEPDTLGFDRNPSFALDIHVVEVLGFHLARGHGSGLFEQPIGERRLAVINMRDDAEIPDIFGHLDGKLAERLAVGQAFSFDIRLALKRGQAEMSGASFKLCFRLKRGCHIFHCFHQLLS